MTTTMTMRFQFNYLPLLIVCCLAASGCESAPKRGGLRQAIDDYNHQRYTQSQEAATAAMANAKSPRREEAAYIAGLSAYRLGQLDEAERRFMTAAESSDPQTAAKAKAMLGQVRLDQHRPREAASYFTEASNALSGDDARKAAYYAAIAYRQAGDAAAAERWLAMSNDPTVGENGSAVGTAFTLQVGAFREKKRAQRAADSVKSLAEQHGLGEVRIVPRHDDRGKALYLVQFGRFPTRQAAAATRAKLGRLEFIVAPLADARS